jgi:hypothetical protein
LKVLCFFAYLKMGFICKDHVKRNSKMIIMHELIKVEEGVVIVS